MKASEILRATDVLRAVRAAAAARRGGQSKGYREVRREVEVEMKWGPKDVVMLQCHAPLTAPLTHDQVPAFDIQSTKVVAVDADDEEGMAMVAGVVAVASCCGGCKGRGREPANQAQDDPGDV